MPFSAVPPLPMFVISVPDVGHALTSKTQLVTSAPSTSYSVTVGATTPVVFANVDTVKACDVIDAVGATLVAVAATVVRVGIIASAFETDAATSDTVADCVVAVIAIAVAGVG